MAGFVYLAMHNSADVLGAFDLPKGATSIAIGFIAPRFPAGMVPQALAPAAELPAGLLAANSKDGDPLFLQLSDGKTLGAFTRARDGRFIRFVGGNQFLMMDGPTGIHFRDVAGVQVAAIASSRSTDISLDAMVDAARQAPIVDVGASEDGSVLVTAAKDGGISVLRAGLKPRPGACRAVRPR